MDEPEPHPFSTNNHLPQLFVILLTAEQLIVLCSMYWMLSR
jgi:hypothetical protein